MSRNENEIKPCYFDEAIGIKIHQYKVKIFGDKIHCCQCGEEILDQSNVKKSFGAYPKGKKK